jgi:hypothetical protein
LSYSNLSNPKVAPPASTGSTTTTSAASSSSSSVPIGGIVGGVIGGVVVIAAMAIFAWYKINTTRKIVPAAMYSANERGGYPSPGPGANQDYIEKFVPNAQEQSGEMPGTPALRYPTEMGAASGKVNGDY